MNVGYLSHARELALGRAQASEEQPLAFFALIAARRLGLSALAANEVVYLAAHLLLAAGAVADRAFRVAGGRRAGGARTFVATLALLPLLASQSGRNNLGVTLAAGLSAGALGAAAAAAVRGRWAPALLAAAPGRAGGDGAVRSAGDLRRRCAGAGAAGRAPARPARGAPGSCRAGGRGAGRRGGGRRDPAGAVRRGHARRPDVRLLHVLRRAAAADVPAPAGDRVRPLPRIRRVLSGASTQTTAAWSTRCCITPGSRCCGS